MAKVVDGKLVIFEGDVYEFEGDTLVFIEGGDEDGNGCSNTEGKKGD